MNYGEYLEVVFAVCIKIGHCDSHLQLFMFQNVILGVVENGPVLHFGLLKNMRTKEIQDIKEQLEIIVNNLDHSLGLGKAPGRKCSRPVNF